MDASTYQQMRDLEDHHWWFEGRRRIISHLLTSLDLPDSARVLEVGCGTGGNMTMLQKFGELTCIEQDEQARSLANKRHLAEVMPGSLPADLPRMDKEFDLIALFDVIEHVKDDRASLLNLSGMLAPGGRIVVTVPAFPFLWSQHDEENQHFRRYRRKDILSLTNACGLKTDYVSYFNFWLFPPVAAVRLIRKLLPYEESWKDMRLPAKPINSLFRRLFGSERFMIPKWSLPWGISLAAVMRNS